MPGIRECEGTVCVKSAAKQVLSRFVVPRLVAVIVVRVLLLAPSGCDYYGKFNLALSAIEQSGCAESIEYSRHEDTFSIEEFNFKIRTKSGCVIRLWFDDGMRVEEACSKPLGILVLNPTLYETIWQKYAVADFSERLADKGIVIKNLPDVLCNAEDLARILRSNYDNKSISRVRGTGSDRSYKRHLKIEVLDEGGGSEFSYTKVR